MFSIVLSYFFLAQHYKMEIINFFDNNNGAVRVDFHEIRPTLTQDISAVRWSWETINPRNERFTSSRLSQYILFFRNSFSSSSYDSSKTVTKPEISENSYHVTKGILSNSNSTNHHCCPDHVKHLCAIAGRTQMVLGVSTMLNTITKNFLVQEKIVFILF